MTATLRFMAAARGGISMAAAIRAAAEAAPLLVVTGRALADLAAELGGMDSAVLRLLELAESVNRPIGVNFAMGPDASSTAFIAPRTWGEERLARWLAAHHEVLGAEFGPIARIGPECPGSGGAR